jgi:hypothetical protein
MGVREDIKSIIIKSGLSMSEVIQILNQKHQRNDTLQNLSNKLAKGTLRYEEALEIADVLDLEIRWLPKEKN